MDSIERIETETRQIQCSNCSTQYQIPASKIPPHGANIKCSRCGHAIVVMPDMAEPIFEESASGHAAIDLIRCPHCGKMVSPEIKLCSFCGGRLSYAVALPKPIIPVRPTDQQKYLGIGILIAGIAGLFFLPLGIGAFIFSAIQLNKAKKEPDLYRDSIVYARWVFWGYLSLLGIIVFLVILIITILALAG